MGREAGKKKEHVGTVKCFSPFRELFIGDSDYHDEIKWDVGEMTTTQCTLLEKAVRNQHFT